MLLIDSADFPRDKTCGDGLTPMAVRTLRKMGVLAQVKAAGAQRIDYNRITGPFGLSATMAFAEYQPDYPYALVLPRLILDDVLRRYALVAGAEFRGGCASRTSGARATASWRWSQARRKAHSRSSHATSSSPSARTWGCSSGQGSSRTDRASSAPPAPISNGVRSAGAEMYDFYFDLKLLPGYGWIFPTGGGRANIGVGVLPCPGPRASRHIPCLTSSWSATARTGWGRPSRPAQSRVTAAHRLPATRAAGENWVIVGEAAGLVNPVTGEASTWRWRAG